MESDEDDDEGIYFITIAILHIFLMLIDWIHY